MSMSICAQSFEQSVDNFEEDENDVQNKYELKTTADSIIKPLESTITTNTVCTNYPYNKTRTRR